MIEIDFNSSNSHEIGPERKPFHNGGTFIEIPANGIGKTMIEPDSHTPEPSSRRFDIIDTASGLEDFARYLAGESRIAVDLEADSMYHFREKVCLLQMTGRDRNVIIDPLVVEDLSPLEPVFADPAARKIFHGADYDIRSLFRDFHIVVNNLFDTQIACRFLGYSETGLEAVLHRFFDISLDKKYQKKDWSARPLPREMLEYAAQDTVFLIPLAEILIGELAEKGRLEWVREECELLSRVRAVSDEDEPLFMKFKGAGRLRRRSLAILENLLQLRREIAGKKDRPLYMVFGNQALLDIVKTRPVTSERLEKSGILSKKQAGMYGPAVIQAVKEALELPEADLPEYPRKKLPPISPRVPERVKLLKGWRDRRAESLEIDPAIVCTKSLMTAIARENPARVEELADIEEMREWQRKAFGHEIIAALPRGKPKKGRSGKRGV
jgi:ribonuclease D